LLKLSDPRPGRKKHFLGQIVSKGPVATGPADKGSQSLLVTLNKDRKGVIGSALYGCNQCIVI
jgi:hypothetical protein